MTRSWRLATVRPSHAEAQRERHAERQPCPEGRLGTRRAGSRGGAPSGGRSTSPATAVDELGGRQLLDPAHQPRGRDDRQVRQHREADDDPGDQPGRDQRAGVGTLAEDAGAARDEREADEQPQRGAEQADDADHGP